MPSWLVPPLVSRRISTRSVPCSASSTGRPRPIPDDGSTRFYDTVHRREVLERAWVKVWRNGGAPGIDHTTIADVDRQGVHLLLDELEAELREGRFKPLPARTVYIPKPGQEELRPLSIPAIRDRVVQAAVKIVLEPVFEADMLPCSFGFRPKRSAHDALQVVLDEFFGNTRWVVETDSPTASRRFRTKV